MEKTLNCLFGLIASLVLIFLNTISADYIPLISIFQFIIPLVSIIGFICAIYFSFIIIIDSIKLINNKEK